MSETLLDFLTISGHLVSRPAHRPVIALFPGVSADFETARPLLVNRDGSIVMVREGIFSALGRHVARLWCGLHGHLILLHFEPNKLSLQCALCGYESEGWEVGHPALAKRPTSRPQAHPERRRALRPLPSGARLAS